MVDRQCQYSCQEPPWSLSCQIAYDWRSANQSSIGLEGGQRKGVDATLLPEICEVWLAARDAGVLQTQQLRIADNADVLMRGLARVGVTALVDEATGYQYIRDRDELHRILEAYISKELLPWAKRFPDEFYKEMFPPAKLAIFPIFRQAP